MSRYIDADVARRIIDSPRSKEQMLLVLSQAEPADVVKVVHGEWVVKGQEVYCSKCKNISGYNWHGASAFSKFCPNCGAKMDLR